MRMSADFEKNLSRRGRLSLRHLGTNYAVFLYRDAKIENKTRDGINRKHALQRFVIASEKDNAITFSKAFIL